MTTVASHDTASAVVAVPATTPDFAYISCGTWSLAGLELDAPVLSEESRAANFTNERGIDGTVRYLRNIMGMWLLEECRRTWAAQGLPDDLPALLTSAAQAEPFTSVVDPDAPEFMTPGDMPERIRAYCRRTNQPAPSIQGLLSAASWRVWPWPTATPCARHPPSPTATSATSTWSAAAPATNCCASSPPTPPASR